MVLVVLELRFVLLALRPLNHPRHPVDRVVLDYLPVLRDLGLLKVLGHLGHQGSPELLQGRAVPQLLQLPDYQWRRCLPVVRPILGPHWVPERLGCQLVLPGL